MMTSARLVLLCFPAFALAAGPIVLPLVEMGNQYGIEVNVSLDSGSSGTVSQRLTLLLHSGSVTSAVLANVLSPGMNSNASVINPLSTIKDIPITADGEVYLYENSQASLFSTVTIQTVDELSISAAIPQDAFYVSANLQYSLVNSWVEGGIITADGVLGLSLQSGTPTVWSAFVQEVATAFPGLNEAVFALNFTTPWRAVNGDTGNASQLHVGGYVESQLASAALLWSSLMPPPYWYEYSFPVYHVSACGKRAAFNLSSVVIGVVNTSSSCLTLPAEMFDDAIRWLPVICQPVQSHGVPSCIIDIHNASYSNIFTSIPLPLLQFQLSESGPLLSIDLMDLILWDDDPVLHPFIDRRYVCLLRGNALNVGAPPSPPKPFNPPLVVFGTMALRSLYTVFNVTSRRIGFASKVSTTGLDEAITAVCKSRVTCIGSQLFLEQANRCLPPPCTQHLFQQLHDETQTCQYTVGFKTFALFSVVIIIILETIVYLWQHQVDAAIHTIQHGSLRNEHTIIPPSIRVSQPPARRVYSPSRTSNGSDGEGGVFPSRRGTASARQPPSASMTNHSAATRLRQRIQQQAL